MNEEQQLKFIHEGSSEEITIGNRTEHDLIKLLKDNNLVNHIWKDYSNSKYDLYFKLYNEDFVRGLQVKSITKRTTRPGYSIKGLNKYENGMLIVALNKELGLGLLYIMCDELKAKTADMTIGGTRGKFSKLLLNWPNFIQYLSFLLNKASIITKEIFRNSMTRENFLEHESILRFIKFCDKFNFNVKRVENNGSQTDLLVNNLKIQMKYCSKMKNPDNGEYSFWISLSKSGGYKKPHIPYEKGDNDFYIIEIGSHHGYFLAIPENILIDKRIIKTDNQTGKPYIIVFPFDYLDTKETNKVIKDKKAIKGNWTCKDKRLWVSSFTDNGDV